VPQIVLRLTQLNALWLQCNLITSISPEFCSALTNLTQLSLAGNQLTIFPAEVAHMRHLKCLLLQNNLLTAVPSELGSLQLDQLFLSDNQLKSIPAELALLPVAATVYLHINPLELCTGRFRFEENVRARLCEIAERTSQWFEIIRERATTVCIALQDLELPAFVTLKIVDALLPNKVKMHSKWQLITAVKHFQQRRAVWEQPNPWDF